MRKYTLALLLLPACLVYACGGGDDSSNPEDGGADASTTDSTVVVTDGNTPDSTVTDTGSPDGTVAKDAGGGDASEDAAKDGGEDAGDGFDGNYPFPVPEGGTVSLQFVGDNAGSTYDFLDGVQWVPNLSQIVISDPDVAGGSGIFYTYAIDAGAPVQSGNTALTGQTPVGNGYFADAGAFVTALANTGTVAMTRVDGGVTSSLVTGFGGKRFNQPNDVVVAANGNIYISDPDYRGTEPQGATGIYVAHPDGGVLAAIPQDGANLAYNGLALSPDQTFLYVSITDTNQVVRYPILANGTLDTANRKLFTNPGTGDAGQIPHLYPDGLTVDDAGNLYVGCEGGVEIYNSAGTYIAFLSIPGRGVSSLAFGGPDRRTLFISANTDLGGGNFGDDGKGALYRMYLNVPGGPTK